jgi:hypothetical protein
MSAGLLSVLSGPSPTPPSQVPLDSASQGILNNMTAQSGQNPSVFAASINQGTGSSLQRNDQQQAQAEAAQGGGMNATDFGAIRNVYNQQAGQQIAQTLNQNNVQAQMMKADYMNATAKAMLGQQQAAVNQYQVLTNAYNQQEQARAGLVSSLFQVANTGMAMNAAKPSAPGQSSMPTTAGPTMAGGAGDASIDADISTTA